MTYDRELFRELDKTAISKVRIGNGAHIAVKGKGTVAIEGCTGLKLISDVLYVPEINQNLLSVTQLLEKGYKVLFKDKNCVIKDTKGIEVFKVQMKGKSFALDLMKEEQAAVHKDDSNTVLWHKRLGHFHHAALLFMKKNNLVKGLPELEEEPPKCAACQYGKQTRLPFPQNKAWRATQRLQLIHTDVADIFWKFKAWVETQNGCKMQVIRSDNGTEYTFGKFNKFCEDTGIEHQLTAPYTPQQNGVVERKNRSIIEMTRFLLHDKGQPKKFWAEAVNTVIFLLNRLPTKALQKKTPFEAWSGYKPELLNLKTFGCLCFSYIPQVKRDKLDKKVESGIFVGYSSISKAYRIYLPQSNKIIVSRDVQLFELDNWSWENDKKLEIHEENDDVDDEPVRGTKSLSDIYQSCNEGGAKDVEKNQTWELVNRPKHKKAIGVKWVYRTKLDPDGSVNKHKARLVVKGYAQMFGVDFSETFAPVARLDTIRMLLALAAQKGWVIHQMDQLEGFAFQGQEEKVCRLKKALYGLKQAPRSWYSRIDAHLVNLGFEKSLSESTLYIKKADDEILVVSLYVDDLLVTGSSKELIDKFKEEMKDVFEMTDLGRMTFFLGMQVHQKQNEIFLCQHKYAKEILKKFNMQECKPTATPMNQKEKFCKEDGAEKVDERLYRSLIGCLMYLTATRPDIMHVVSLLSRYMHCASEIHFQAAKRILRYVKGTIDSGIRFSQVKNFNLHGYSDSDWAGCVDDMRNTSGYCFSFGSGIFSWCSKKQEVIAQSTAEAEYVAATAAVNQALWIRKLMTDLHMEQQESTQIFVDNQAAISIASNPVFHGKTKHFKIKFYLLREVQREGEVQLIYCKTENQSVDILTKALPKIRYEFLRQKLGVCSSRVKEEY
ncbi:unnamed protein product [Camellia sinensis]